LTDKLVHRQRPDDILKGKATMNNSNLRTPSLNNIEKTTEQINVDNLSSDDLERIANPVLRAAMQNAKNRLETCSTAQHSNHTQHENNG
jgi:hypothetical protein